MEHGVGVLARVPFDEGGLTGSIGPDSEFPEGDFRARLLPGRPQAAGGRSRAAIVDDLGIAPDAIAETALRYILSADAVSTVIPGMRSIRNVERNCAAGDGRGLPRPTGREAQAHRWVRNFYR